MDDGSTDNTLEIVSRYESKLVKVIREINKGAPAARNKALSLAQGDYIQWRDSDDILAVDKISQQMDKIDRDSTDKTLYSCCFQTFYYSPERELL